MTAYQGRTKCQGKVDTKKKGCWKKEEKENRTSKCDSKEIYLFSVKLICDFFFFFTDPHNMIKQTEFKQTSHFT